MKKTFKKHARNIRFFLFKVCYHLPLESFTFETLEFRANHIMCATEDTRDTLPENI